MMTFLSEKSVFRVIVVALVLATIYRLYPLVSGERVLAEAFMTEDGYLMLTVARNMAIGLGMSVSDGTIPTNGVQPLATFLFAMPYLLTEGDKVQGLWGVQIISAIIAVIGIFTVRAFARESLTPQDKSPIWPWMVTAQESVNRNLDSKARFGGLFIGAPGMARSALTGAVPIRVVAVG